MVNTEIRFIIFFAAKDGETIQSAKVRPGADWLRSGAFYCKIQA